MPAQLARVSLSALVCVVCPSTGARADDASSYGATANVVRPMAATNREDATASGSEIDTRTRDAAHETVSDVLLEVPGARPFRTGWLSSFTSASLRGADIDHTVVLLGDIPISSADAAAFDLSTVPLSVLDRIVVYRGGAPAWLSQGAIGGVVQLVPRSAEGTSLSATGTAGSFGTYGVSAQSSVVPSSQRTPSLLAAAGIIGSSGDFRYTDDNNTSFDPSDDHVVRRRNADFLDGHGLVSVRQPLGEGAIQLVVLGYEHAAGEPGPPAYPAYQARRLFTRGVLGIDYTLDRLDARGERVLRLQALAAGSLTRTRFTDLSHEIGPAQPKLTDDVDGHALGKLAATAAVTNFLELTLIGTAQRDAHAPTNPFVRVPVPDSTRTTFAATGETRLHGRVARHSVELRPSLRVEQHVAELQSEHFKALVQTHVRDALPTYRVALGVGLLPDLTLTASSATGARAPSMLELFGDGALIVGETALRPEHSTTYEVGLVDVTCVGDFAGSFELRAFDLSIQDQITFVRNSFSQLIPLNLLDSHVQGIEAGARASLGPIWLNGATTLLDTEGKPGKHLPNRPRATLFVQPGISSNPVGPFDAVRAFVEGSYTASSYDDPDNATQPKRAQFFFDVGTTLVCLHKHAELRLTMSDVFDRGGEDLRHFPLPGRTILASLTYKEDLR